MPIFLEVASQEILFQVLVGLKMREAYERLIAAETPEAARV